MDHSLRTGLLALGAISLGVLAMAGVHPDPPPRAPVLLPAARAAGLSLDTLALGGYARGSFRDAVRLLASDLSPAEQTMVGEHLERIFADVREDDGLGHAGRLRVAYERALRPDGSPRSIRVLAAEAAAGGSLHTAYLFERAGKPGYYDGSGRSLDPRAWTGPLADAHVSSLFGARRIHPILGRILPHTGVDYAATSGTPVRATGDGLVSSAGRRGGYGNLVEIQHPSGLSTRYAHLSAIARGVRRAGYVRQGEVIGYVGMTGLATGPHLHYEVRRQGRAVDPLRVLTRGGATADVWAEKGWAEARTELGRLLARTPTMLRAR